MSTEVLLKLRRNRPRHAFDRRDVVQTCRFDSSDRAKLLKKVVASLFPDSGDFVQYRVHLRCRASLTVELHGKAVRFVPEPLHQEQCP